MIDYRKIKESKVAIHDNILINHDVAIAYFVIYPYNYGVMDFQSIKGHIDHVYNTLKMLYQSLGEMKVSMFKLKNIISKEETMEMIAETIKMYKKDYNGFPPEYRKYIQNFSKDFSILAVQIDTKNSIDLEHEKITSVFKHLINNFLIDKFSTTAANIDEDSLNIQNTNLKNSLQRFAVPASEKLVMNIYINSIFPSYNLVYKDFYMEHKEPILSGVKQEIIPHLGWFEMSNSGIVDFGAEARTTYGCVLTILEFPKSINSEDFNIDIAGMHVNMNMLPKDKALLKFKRLRAGLNEEMGDGFNPDSDVGSDAKFNQRIIYEINNKGRIATEVDCNILVLARSKEELDKKKKLVIKLLSKKRVVCSIAANQAKTFVYSFIKKRPMEYYHIMDMRYAISFQLDSGVAVGDGSSSFSMPVIGSS